VKRFQSKWRQTAAAAAMLACALAPVGAAPPAFPRAEGFGASAAGGRGGTVIKVTNLNAKGPGSLQAACQARGPRIVVFDVSGVIRGNVTITQPCITIAGQTAPGGGITIEGMLCSQYRARPSLKEIVIRFLRIRRNRTYGHSGDAVQITASRNVILDHVSLAWANDESIDMSGCSGATVQWCTIEESDTEGHEKGRHNYGPLFCAVGSGNLSIHHNLLAHHSRRCPALMPETPGWPGDFRNNVVYNFREGLSREGRTRMAPINLLNNYYKRGPSAARVRLFSLVPNVKYHIAGNFVEGVGLIGDPRRTKANWPAWLQSDAQGQVLTAPAKVAPVTTQSAEQAYRLVLAQAGCLPRDRVTRRTLQEVVKGTGKWGRNAPLHPTDEWYMHGLKPTKPPTDSDNDGMPDAWERKRGLDPRSGADANRKMPTGYTAIEQYLNEQADELIRRARAD
jgi:pectate lyase